MFGLISLKDGLLEGGHDCTVGEDVELFFASRHVLIEFYHIIGSDPVCLFKEEDIIYPPIAVFVSGVENRSGNIKESEFRLCAHPCTDVVELSLFFSSLVMEVGLVGGKLLVPLHVGSSRKHRFKGLPDLLGSLFDPIFAACKEKSDYE